MGLLSGRTLGPYTLGDELGGSSRALIYRAVHGPLQRPRAVKIPVFPSGRGGPGATRRFHREAWIAAQLRHPNVVRVYDVGEQDGLPYIAMELLDGRSLRDIVRTEGPLALDRAVRLLRHLSDAVDYVHSRDVVHRDVMAKNVVVGWNDDLWLIDFGKARLAGQSLPKETGRVEARGHGVLPVIDGEPMSQLIDRSRLAFSADLGGLGMIAYELLTGRPPFEGWPTWARKTGQAGELPPSPRALRPALPELVEQVLLRPITADPARRYRTAGDLVGELACAAQACS